MFETSKLVTLVIALRIFLLYMHLNSVLKARFNSNVPACWFICNFAVTMCWWSTDFVLLCSFYSVYHSALFFSANMNYFVTLLKELLIICTCTRLFKYYTKKNVAQLSTCETCFAIFQDIINDWPKIVIKCDVLKRDWPSSYEGKSRSHHWRIFCCLLRSAVGKIYSFF